MTDNIHGGARYDIDLSSTDFYQLAADRMKAGDRPAAIQQEFVARGLDPEDAAAVVRRVGITRRQRIRAAGRKAMIFGGVAVVIGLTVTVITYEMADDLGGYFFLFPGAMLGGLLQLIWGLFKYRSA